MVYDYGGIFDYLVDINFPKKGKVPPIVVQPWFWYLKRQGPIRFFSFLGESWGPGWVWQANLPVIKILPIDTQIIVPTTSVGFGSLEEAIDRTNNGEPISQDAWGRFYWHNRKGDDFWWLVNGKRGKEIPEYSVKKGCPTQPTDPKTGLPVGRPLPRVWEDVVHSWRDHWNDGALAANSGFAGVSGSGGYSSILPSNGGFFIPGPNPNETIPELQRRLATDQYFGAPPITEIFQTGQAAIFKQAWAFTIEVAQLDPFEWEFETFPPKRTSLSQFKGGSGLAPFAATLNASANNPSILAGILPPFPQNSPILLGGGNLP